MKNSCIRSIFAQNYADLRHEHLRYPVGHWLTRWPMASVDEEGHWNMVTLRRPAAFSREALIDLGAAFAQYSSSFGPKTSPSSRDTRPLSLAEARERSH
jgi:hypothetical protein